MVCNMGTSYFWLAVNVVKLLKIALFVKYQTLLWLLSINTQLIYQ